RNQIAPAPIVAEPLSATAIPSSAAMVRKWHLPAAMEDLRMRLEREHDAWRGLVADLARDLEGGDGNQAVASLNALGYRFRRSGREEEERVLPALEQLTGVAAFSRAAAARSEHRVLLDLLGGIERAVTASDLVVAAIDLRELAVTLELHMRKELQMIDLL